MIEINCRVVAKYINSDPDQEKVFSPIKGILKEDGYSRSFSQLLHADLDYLVPNGCLGSIIYDKSKRTVNPPPYFLEYVRDAMSILTRDKEAGNRVIIALYLIAAIKLGRAEFNIPRLALHLEVEVKGETIPNVGFIHGVLDFVAAKVTGQGNLDKTMIEGRNAGSVYRMDLPYLIVCEAKKTSAVEPEAELLGQLRVLMLKHGEACKTGILADGFHWRLFHFDTNLILYYGELDLESDEDRIQLLGILSLHVAGRSPIPRGPHNPDEPLHLALDR